MIPMTRMFEEMSRNLRFALIPPALSEFDALIKEARRQGKRSGLTKTELRNTVKSVKGRK